jgi:hypothetical protein
MEYSYGSLEVVFIAYPQLSLQIILQNRQDAVFPKSCFVFEWLALL